MLTFKDLKTIELLPRIRYASKEIITLAQQVGHSRQSRGKSDLKLSVGFYYLILLFLYLANYCLRCVIMGRPPAIFRGRPAEIKYHRDGGLR